jgi:hypothetical protein
MEIAMDEAEELGRTVGGGVGERVSMLFACKARLTDSG